eukprot:1138187-Pelagomonas_calceolata.AAC.3
MSIFWLMGTNMLGYIPLMESNRAVLYLRCSLQPFYLNDISDVFEGEAGISGGMDDIRRVEGGASGGRAWHGTECVGTTVGLRAVPQASACGQQLLAASLASLLGCRL